MIRAPFFRVLWVIVGCLTCWASGPQAQGAGAECFPRVATYELDAAFFPDDAFMRATARITFEPNARDTDHIVFFLHGELKVDSLLVDDRPAPVVQDKVFYDSAYAHVATRITIDLAPGDVPDTLTVMYAGYFHPSKARSPSDYMRIDGDGVLLRAYGYSMWFPLFTDGRHEGYAVDFTRVRLDVPAEFRVVFTGELLGEQQKSVAGEESQRRISQWRSLDTSLYAAQCTARRFLITEQDKYRVYHESDPASRQAAGEIVAFVAGLDARFRQEYGDPGGSAGVHVMQMPQYGDIASGNVVGLSEHNWREFSHTAWGRRTVAHELVHAFVQPPVRLDDPLFALVIEGFPSYFHLPVVGDFLGPDVYADWMQQTEAAYLQRRLTGLDRRGRTLPPEIPLLDLTDDDIGTYKDRFVLNDRARLFWHWIRSQLGQERFRELTRELFALSRLDAAGFREFLLRYMPGAGADVDLWLGSTEFPERIRIR